MSTFDVDRDDKIDSSRRRSAASTGSVRQYTAAHVAGAIPDFRESPATRRTTIAASLAASALVALTACTTSRHAPEDGSSAPSSTASVHASPTTNVSASPLPLRSSPSSASPAGDARVAATTAYLGMWVDFAAAGRTSDWRSPLLAQHATAYALQVMEKSLYTDHKNGVITKGAPVDHPRVKSTNSTTNPTVILISDCGDSSRWLKYRAKTGKPVAGSPGGRQAITAEVRKQPDGSWKVDQFAVEGTGTC